MTFKASCTHHPKDQRLSGWYHLLPKPTPLPPLESNQTADIAIIGAGFAGLAAARRLHQNDPTLHIAVVEAQGLAWAANGRNSGFMIDLPHELNSNNYAGALDKDLQQIVENRLAIEFVRDAVDEFGLQDFFSPVGKYHGATNGAGLKALHEFAHHLDAINEPYQVLNRDELKQAIGTSYYDGGLHTPGAALLQPAGYIVGLGQGLNAYDKINIYEHSPVLSIESHATGVELTTARGKLHAKQTILANNGHIESFGIQKNKLLHLFTYASMSEELSTQQWQALGQASSWGLIPASPMGTTLRKLESRRLLIRNQWTYNPNLECSDNQLDFYAEQHDRCLVERYPELAKTNMEYRWSGPIAMTLNSSPIFGEVAPNVYAAAGCQGLGTTRSTLLGMMIADKLCGIASASLKSLESLPKPSRLPPRWLNKLAIPSYLKWQHWRAGKDL